MGRECATPNLASNRGFGRDFVTIDDPNRVCPREDLNLSVALGNCSLTRENGKRCEADGRLWGNLWGIVAAVSLTVGSTRPLMTSLIR